jgi:hypothetical protein
MKTNVRMVELCMYDLPYGDIVQKGSHIVWTVVVVFP